MSDQGSEGLLSPFLRRRRFQAALPYLKGRVLDFGCGSGKLARLIPVNQYYGVEVDTTSLQQAVLHFPLHHFSTELPKSSDLFDTIISLAVIEHVSDPIHFLKTLTTYLKSTPTARIVITTPHPHVDWVHDAGAAIGLFSKHANEEHHDLLDREKLENVGSKSGLKLISYQRFLFGANQLAVYGWQE